MRRTIALGSSILALLAFAPAALAHRSGHHHARPHHGRLHHQQFGKFNSSVTSQGTTNGPSGGTPGPVGTITSFSNNVLTITLGDGTVVTGTITSDTRIECVTVSQNGGGSDGAEGTDFLMRPADDHAGLGNTSDDDSGSGSGPETDGGDASSQGGGCTTADLTPTAGVLAARLDLSSAGAIWTRIVLNK